ncbi:MAG: hypothetical protein JXR29_06735 [Methylothermaceae bacterium]|nr:hypothetical protein [Methylothermaceae bacterium]
MNETTTEENWWVQGWLYGKYGQKGQIPESYEDIAEWVQGYKFGKAEIGRFDQWRSDLLNECPEILDSIPDVIH